MDKLERHGKHFYQNWPSAPPVKSMLFLSCLAGSQKRGSQQSKQGEASISRLRANEAPSAREIAPYLVHTKP